MQDNLQEVKEIKYIYMKNNRNQMGIHNAIHLIHVTRIIPDPFHHTGARILQGDHKSTSIGSERVANLLADKKLLPNVSFQVTYTPAAVLTLN